MSAVPPSRYPGRLSWRAASAAAIRAQRATVGAFGPRPRRPVSRIHRAAAWGGADLGAARASVPPPMPPMAPFISDPPERCPCPPPGSLAPPGGRGSDPAGASLRGRRSGALLLSRCAGVGHDPVVLDGLEDLGAEAVGL